MQVCVCVLCMIMGAFRCESDKKRHKRRKPVCEQSARCSRGGFEAGVDWQSKLVSHKAWVLSLRRLLVMVLVWQSSTGV